MITSVMRFMRLTVGLQTIYSLPVIPRLTCLKLNAMKPLLSSVLTFLLLAAGSAHAASDTDVTIIKAEKIVIEDDVITIVAEAKIRMTLIQDNDDAIDKGTKWMGRPAAHVQVKADKATFIVKRPRDPGLEAAWQNSLQAAKDLQEGKEVGRIGYYAPDMNIRGNLIVSITGIGYLYPKRM